MYLCSNFQFWCLVLQEGEKKEYTKKGFLFYVVLESWCFDWKTGKNSKRFNSNEGNLFNDTESSLSSLSTSGILFSIKKHISVDFAIIFHFFLAVFHFILVCNFPGVFLVKKLHNLFKNRPQTEHHLQPREHCIFDSWMNTIKEF